MVVLPDFVERVACELNGFFAVVMIFSRIDFQRHLRRRGGRFKQGDAAQHYALCEVSCHVVARASTMARLNSTDREDQMTQMRRFMPLIVVLALVAGLVL